MPPLPLVLDLLSHPWARANAAAGHRTVQCDNLLRQERGRGKESLPHNLLRLWTAPG